LLLLAQAAGAQQVSITGTIKDPNSTPYAGGSGTVSLYPAGLTWTVNGSQLGQTQWPISGLDGFGHFSIQLWPTNQLVSNTGASAQYVFNFCSASYRDPAVKVCFTMTPLTLTTAQDISTTAKAQAATLPQYPSFGSGGGGGGSGTVSYVGLSDLSWLSVSGTPITTSGTFTVSPATGQTSHEVIGTCGTATQFTPCALTATDLPSSGVTAGSYTNSNITVNAEGQVTAASNGSGTGANTTLSNLTSPTAINQNLIPSGTISLGSAAAPFANIYTNAFTFTGSDLFLGATASTTCPSIVSPVVGGLCVIGPDGVPQLWNPNTTTWQDIPGLTAAGGLNLLGPIALGSSTPTACSGTTGCVALTESSTAGTPTSGVDYQRADATTHKFLCSYNGASEVTCGGSGTVNQNTIMLGSLANPCTGQANCVQMNLDTQMTQGCTFNATTTIVCPTGTFKSTDVGKKIAAYNTCQTAGSGYTNEFGTTATTISSYTNSTTVIASTATAGSVSATGCIYWGHSDETGASGVDTLMATYNATCPVLVLPQGIMWLNQQNHFSTAPTGCAQTPSVSGASATGFSFGIVGQGATASRIFFDNTTSFTAPLMTLVYGGFWYGWGIDGGGNPGTASGGTPYGMLANNNGYQYIENWACTNLGLVLTTVYGPTPGLVLTGYNVYLINALLDGCGNIGIYSYNTSYTSPGSNFAIDVSVQDNVSGEWLAYNELLNLNDTVLLDSPSGASSHYGLSLGNSTLNANGLQYGGNGASSPDVGIISQSGYNTINLNQSTIVPISGNSDSGHHETAIQCVAACALRAGSSTIVGASGGKDLSLGIGSVFYDTGHPNIYSNGAPNFSTPAFGSNAQFGWSYNGNGSTSTSSLTSGYINVPKGWGILVVGLSTASISSVTDLGGCSFTAQTQMTSNGNNARFYLCASSSGYTPDTITVNFSASEMYNELIVWLVPPGAVVDTQGDNGSTSQDNVTTSLSLTTATANEYVFEILNTCGLNVSYSTSGGSSLIYSGGTGQTSSGSLPIGGYSPGYFSGGQQLFSSSGSNTLSIAYSGSTCNGWNAFGIAIKGLPTSAQVMGNSSFLGLNPLSASAFVASANWGTGAAISAVTGNQSNFSFTLTNGTSTGASPTITFTYPSANLVAPSKCTLWQVGGTQAVTATTAVLGGTSLSASSAIFTYPATPTASDTEFYQGTCAN
jgi:hypothetical protein